MVPPSPTVLAIAGWWIPTLGLLLAALGVGLLAASVGDRHVPTDRIQATAASVTPVTPTPTRKPSTTRQADAERTATAAIVGVARNLPPGPVACLGADLATGRRAESAHLATVPLQRPAECGDLRDVIVGFAALPHTGRAGGGDPGASAEAVPPEAGELDRTAAALYGPPDRRPQTTIEALLEAGGPDGGRGRARDYLEETAVSRMLMP
jgi:hypothetical protein